MDPRSEQAERAHVFEGDVPVKTRYDMNGDGKIDEVYVYRKHSIERIEWDRDKDGTFDFRAIYEEPADGQRNLRYRLKQIKGEFRFIPAITAAQWPAHGNSTYAGPSPRYETLVDGVWSGDFTTELKHMAIAPACGEVAVVSTFVCRGGKPVRLTTPANKEHGVKFAQTRFEDGRRAKHVSGASPDRIMYEVDFLHDNDVLSVSRSDTDGDGAFDYEVTQRQTSAGYSLTSRIRKADGWTGTYAQRGMRYVNGLHTETIDPRTGNIHVRYEYDEQGNCLWTYTDQDKNGKLETRLSLDGQAQGLRNGVWIGDFIDRY